MDKFKIALLGIFVLSAVLRFSFLNISPPSLNWDEASLGYNAYSILKTGSDEWGKPFPLTFEAFGDYKLPVYVYTLVPFVGLFSLNDWSVKLPSELSGIFAPVLLYLIIVSLTKKKSLGLSAAFLLAISPWHIFLSRIALEANLALTLFLAALYTFLLGLKKPWLLSLSAILFGLTVFTYNSARIFSPLFILTLLFVYRKELLSIKKYLILPIILIALFMGAAGYLALTEDSSSRYYWVTIIDQGAINYLNESRGNSTLDPTLTKIIYNRYSYFAYVFVKNYFSHFTPDYLFFEGGSNHQFSVPDFGLLYLFEAPLFLLGLVQSLRKRSIPKLIFAWLLIAPIPSAITREAPHVLRSIFMLGSLQVFTGFGLVEVIDSMKKFRVSFKVFFNSLIALIIALNMSVFLYLYLITYPVNNSQSWQYSMEGVMETLSTLNNGQPIYITKRLGEPHIYYLFYNKYDPYKYQHNPTLVRYARTNWRWVDRLDNVYFVNDWEIKQQLENVHGAVAVVNHGDYPQGAQVIKSFYFLNGTPSLDIVKL